MNPDIFSSLAGSKDAALALSLVMNGALMWALLKIYHAKEALQNQMIELLKQIIPLAVRMKDRLGGK